MKRVLMTAGVAGLLATAPQAAESQDMAMPPAMPAMPMPGQQPMAMPMTGGCPMMRQSAETHRQQMALMQEMMAMMRRMQPGSAGMPAPETPPRR